MTKEVPGEGKKPCDVVYVGEGPGRVEEARGRPFVGPSGKLLWRFSAKYLGLKRSDVYVTNLVKTRLTDARGKDRPPTDAEREHWTPKLKSELLSVQPKYVITLGRHSTQALLGRPVVMEAVHGIGEGVTLPSASGLLRYGCVVIPIFHPAAGLHQERMLPFTARGLEMAASVIAGKSAIRYVNQQPRVREYGEGFSQEDYVKLASGKNVPIAIDTEGSKRSPWSVQVSWKRGQARFIRADDRKSLLLLAKYIKERKPTIFMHYALHDVEVSRTLKIDLLEELKAGRIVDTLVLAASLPGEPGELKSLAERHLNVSVKRFDEVVQPAREKKIVQHVLEVLSDETIGWPEPEGRKHSIPKRLQGLLRPSKTGKTVWEKWSDKSFAEIREQVEFFTGAAAPELELADLPQQEFREYACSDADWTRQLQAPLTKQLYARGGKGGLASAALDHSALPLLARMERAGMKLDLQRAEGHVEFLKQLRADAQAAVELATEGAVTNPMSGDQVAAFCEAQAAEGRCILHRQTKAALRYSTDDNALKAIRNDHVAIDYIIEYRAADKQLGIMQPILKLVQQQQSRGGDGRLRYVFNVASVRTGRYSMDSPNLLAAPKRGPLGKGFRKCFVAEDGKRIGSCDLSQIELRVAAALSQDAEMLAAFARGDDLHALTAVRLGGASWDDAKNNDDVRIPWKTANFAMLYLASARRLHEEYVANGITQFDEDDCERIKKDWFKLYKGVREFFDLCIHLGRREGYVKTPYGRMRPLPAIGLKGEGYPISMLREGDERKACNTPIQGGAAELFKRAMAGIEVMLPKECVPLLIVHDDFLSEFPEEEERHVRQEIVAAMTADSPWRGVKIEAEWKSGASWGELRKEERR